ncbi:hypothetical protein AOL_s00006g406 [Orbilia oligospora ATCC 24927]|uniref:Uncharacterized protein n=1 Tax=Arthrobotrys oligospora (strain ATCC 24927 / CBS 115.81 / DSM 1491) TaxID=756982 RepID=G1X0K5_ARTOA|nr:hypothetical protein AOL_s00006g406 [Orbilia oligospora ATCC 24927]EGX53540.1 hypothetical protein AOL_s00006g406 [Orbilia oligospora ATCC 24927]
MEPSPSSNPTSKQKKSTPLISKLPRIPSFKPSKPTSSKTGIGASKEELPLPDLPPHPPLSHRRRRRRRSSHSTTTPQHPEPRKPSKLSQLKSRLSSLKPSKATTTTTTTIPKTSPPPSTPALEPPTTPPTIPSPTPSSPPSSPAQSFHTAHSFSSSHQTDIENPPNTPFIPCDISIASSDAIYQLSSPAKFWENIHKRNEMKRIKAEKLREAEKEVSLCERIRRERFKVRKVVSVIDEEEEMVVYMDGSDEEDGDEDGEEEEEGGEEKEAEETEEDGDENTGCMGFNWVKKLEERYYGLDEGDGGVDLTTEEDHGPIPDDINVNASTEDRDRDHNEDEEEDKPETTSTYLERIDELRRALGNAVADVALRPADWRKLID